MKIPVNCPHCGDVMLTEFDTYDIHVVIKTCKKRTDHHLTFYADRCDVVYSIKLSTCRFRGPVFWEIDNKVCLPGMTTLPYFEPDLTDLHKLVEKLKTYLVFS